MTICDAYLLKGWLIAERAPPEIMDAIESVIECLSAAESATEVTSRIHIEIPVEPVEDHQPQEPAAPVAESAEHVPPRQNGSATIPDDDVKKVTAMSETMTDDEIAAEYGCSRSTVMRYRVQHGIKKKKGRRVAQAVEPAEPAVEPPTGNQDDQPPPKPTKQKRNWSPEARAAASERMRARRAAQAAKGSSRSRSWGFSGGQPEPVTIQGETTTFTDEHGHKVTKLPPGYARGAEPDSRVRPKSGYGF